LNSIVGFFQDRIQVNSLLVVLCLVSVLGLSSQSAASYSTYFLALAMLFSARQWRDVFSVRLLWGIVGLLVYLSLTSLWSDPFDVRKTLSVLVRALLVMFFVVAFAECQQRGQLQNWLARAMAVVGSLAVLAAIVVFIVTKPEGGRLNGLGQLHSQIIAALVYGVVLIFVVQVFFTHRLVALRGLAVVGASLIGYAVFLTDSRNAWVSVSTGLGIFVLAHWIRDKQRFLAAVAMMGFAGVVLLGGLLAFESTREILLPRGASFRPDIWGAIASKVINANPWIGLGVLTENNVVVDGIEFLHPHSLYLSVFFQGGLVGVTLLILVLVGTLRVLFENYETSNAKLALAILGIALPAYLLDGHELIDKVGSTWFLFWLPVGISLGLRWNQPVR
jgi:O-antigen ligase